MEAQVDLIDRTRSIRWGRVDAWPSEATAGTRCRGLIEKLEASGFTGGQCWSVDHSYLVSDLRNQGLGVDGYLAMLAFIVVETQQEKILFSNDECGGAGTSDSAMRVWDTLARLFPHAHDISPRSRKKRIMLAVDFKHPVLWPRVEAYLRVKYPLRGTFDPEDARMSFNRKMR